MKKGRKSSTTTRGRDRLQQSGMKNVPETRLAGQVASNRGTERGRLWRRLAELEAELNASRRKLDWLEAALDGHRHSRQVLEAAVSADYSGTISRIRDVVRATIPPGATVLVVSKGDAELLRLEGRQGWHFPRNDDGEYAGYHPADSAAAIEHLQSLIAKGGQFLVFPNIAFWWLEHYRDLAEHLDQCHVRIWRDDRCAIYRLGQGSEISPDGAARPRARRPVGTDEEVLKATRSGRHDVVCFPVIDWDYRFQRPQQLMLQFAAAGHRVFYLSHECRKAGEPYVLRHLSENLFEVSLCGPRFKVREGGLDDRTCEMVFASLHALQREHALKSTAAIVQSPFWWPLARRARTAFGWPVVYDCLDHQAGFVHGHPLMMDAEREMLTKANLVAASSAALEAVARKHNRHVLLLRNACDYDHFARVVRKPPGPRPTIGYFGAIAEWFDSDLVADLAERRPDWDFVLVGSTVFGDIGRLAKLPNVSLPGEKPYAEIPDWLTKFDVTILPFKRTPLTEATNPVKAYEILASGRPLVSVPLPEMVRLAPLVRLASTPEEFERKIEAELRRPGPNLEAKRRSFARENTWRRRFEALSRAIRRLGLRTPAVEGSRRNRCCFATLRNNPRSNEKIRARMTR